MLRLKLLVSMGAMLIMLAAPAQAQSSFAVEEAIRATWPEHEEDYAIAIAACESGLGADIYNEASGAGGAFQMMPATAAGIGYDYNRMLYDPWYAAEAAYVLYSQQGWYPWSCHYLV